MSIITLEKFGGIIPKIGNAALPDGAASYAHNVDIVGGVIRPLAADGVIQNTVGVGELSGADVTSVGLTKPASPPLGFVNYLCRPTEGGWLSIEYWVLALFTPDDGTDQYGRWIHGNVTISSIKNTEQGLTIFGEMNPDDPAIPEQRLMLTAPGVVKIYGPNYRFQLLSSPGYGGAETTTVIPGGVMGTFSDISIGMPEIPSAKVPLAFNNGEGQNTIIYGNFEVVDVTGPKWEEEYSMAAASLDNPAYFFFPYIGVTPKITFNINLNYAEPRRRYFYYVSTNTDPAGEIEGPPSDVSNEIQLKPGQFVSIDTGITNIGKLYRSNTGGDDFGLLDGNISTQGNPGSIDFQDWGRGVTNIPIPPYGNFPGAVAEPAENTLLHPAKFGVFWKTTSNILYLSDRYRLHAWPGDYTVPFPENILGCVMSGNTIIVFTTNSSGSGRVYGVSGSNPDNMQSVLLSDDKPVLSMANVCRINQMIYWTTPFGLCACNGGDVKIITEPYFMGTSDWGAGLASSPLYVADGVLYVVGNVTYRIELDEDVIRSITTLDAAALGTITASTPTLGGSFGGLIGRNL